MSEENKVKDTAEAVTSVLKELSIYPDLLQPAVKELGKGLETIAKSVHLALAPLSALIWGYDQFKIFLEGAVTEKLKNVPPENIIPPKLHVAGPALDALRYAGSETTLREMYANLLASAMDSATTEYAHPAFVEIIKQLTPDEARLISLLTRNIALPMIDIRAEYKPTTGKVGGGDLVKHYSHFDKLIEFQSPNLLPAYIDNLCRLGIAQVPHEKAYTFPGAYDDLKNDPIISEQENLIDKNLLKIVTHNKMLSITEMGKNFVAVCVMEKH